MHQVVGPAIWYLYALSHFSGKYAVLKEGEKPNVNNLWILADNSLSSVKKVKSFHCFGEIVIQQSWVEGIFRKKTTQTSIEFSLNVTEYSESRENLKVVATRDIPCPITDLFPGVTVKI